MPVIINNKRVLPAPLVTFGKTIVLSDDGVQIGADYSISLAGKILQNKGNPISTIGEAFSSTLSTDEWTSTRSPDDDPLHGVGDTDLLISTITKIEQLRNLFSPATGVKVEIIGFDHNQGIKFYGDVKSFNIDSEGQWAKPCNYTIDIGFSNFIESANPGLFTAGSSEDSFSYYVSSVKENWGIQEADQVVVDTGDWSQISKVYNITHSVDAKGKRVYNSSGIVDSQPWQQASGYVGNIIGLGRTNLPDSILGITSGYYITNHKLNETIDKSGGTYAVEETFSYVPSGSMPANIANMAFEECTINIEKGEGPLSTVGIQGTIVGFETNSQLDVSRTGVTKYNNALSYYNLVESGLYTRARTNSGLSWLHPKAKSKTVGLQPNAGTISYSHTYDNRMPNLIPGSVSEDISINDTYPGQLFSATPVIGRSQPILQYLGSRSEYKRSLNININMDTMSPNWSNDDVDSNGLWTTRTETGVRYWLVGSKPSLLETSSFSGIYEAANPANELGVVASKTFYGAPQESWNRKSGAYTYSIEWTFEKIT